MCCNMCSSGPTLIRCLKEAAEYCARVRTSDSEVEFLAFASTSAESFGKKPAPVFSATVLELTDLKPTKVLCWGNAI